MLAVSPPWVPPRNLDCLAALLDELFGVRRRRGRKLDARLAVADTLWALGWDRSAALDLVGSRRFLDRAVALAVCTGSAGILPAEPSPGHDKERAAARVHLKGQRDEG